MILGNVDIFYDSLGNKVSSVGEAIVNVNSDIEAPIVIGKGCQVDTKYLGAYTVINDGTKIRFTNEIGRFCEIGSDCIIGLPEHPLNSLSVSTSFYTEDRWKNINHFSKYSNYKSEQNNVTKNLSKEGIVVGNDVWIGSKTLIKRGVKIGDGAVIGGGAVVTKDIPPYAIVGGGPGETY